MNDRQLRVALVASSLRLGGAEKQTLYQARALLRAELEARFLHVGDAGYYEAAVRRTGIPFERVHASDQPWLSLARVTVALCRWRPQIVLAAQFDDLLFAALGGRACGALVLGGVRSDGFYELNAHGRLSRWLIRLAHGLVANSNRARQNLAARGVALEKIVVLPNVIDLQEFDARSALSVEVLVPADRLAVIAVGSLHPAKRFDRFLEALALARRRVPALSGILAGVDAGAKSALQARAAALGLASPDCVFLGETDRVPALLRRCSMLALTSDSEGFPNVLLEAMAARLPVISTPAGDAEVIVQQGQTGYLVPSGDIPAMADAMVRLALSPGLRVALGEAARQRVEREYGFESLASRILALFQHFARQQRKIPLSALLAGLRPPAGPLNHPLPLTSDFQPKDREMLCATSLN